MVGVKILFEDQDLLLIFKPAGLVVNRAQTVGKPTLQDWLAKKVPNIGQRSGIVHRLDKETSGLLLVAKTLTAFENLQKQFKKRQVQKRYLALVHGQMVPAKGVIKAAISRSPFNREKFGVFLGGRGAETGYRTLRYYNKENLGKFSLLELKPKTGRTHQIRVHLQYLGHPVVADAKYAGRKTARLDRTWCSRQFLHASSLTFFHPRTGKKITFACQLPEDLKKALQSLS